MNRPRLRRILLAWRALRDELAVIDLTYGIGHDARVRRFVGIEVPPSTR